MSAISASGLSQFYQSLSVSGGTSVQSPDATSQTDGSSTSASDGSQVQGHHHRHGGGGGGGQFFSKIQSAVTDALQSAAQSGTDPNQAIQTAIENLFKNGGNPATDSSTDPNAATDPTATTDSSTATDPSTAGTVDPQSARDQFFQTLQASGIDPQQFHQDFLAALQDAQTSGNTDPSSVFKNFPPGTVVDTTA